MHMVWTRWEASNSAVWTVRNARVACVLRQTLVRSLGADGEGKVHRFRGCTTERSGRTGAMVCSFCASSSPASPVAPLVSSRKQHLRRVPGQSQEPQGLIRQGEGGGPEARG